MADYKNDTQALQGVRDPDGVLHWVKPGDSITFGAKTKESPKEPKPVEADEPEEDAETDEPHAGLTDDELRDLIEDKTGERPHHRTARAKLLSQLA